MTQREFYTAIINANVSEDITAYAQGRIAHLDNVNEHRKGYKTPAQREKAEQYAEFISKVEKGVQFTTSALAEQFNISNPQAVAFCEKAFKTGVATKGEVKIKGKGKVKGYTFTEGTPEVETED